MLQLLETPEYCCQGVGPRPRPPRPTPSGRRAPRGPSSFAPFSSPPSSDTGMPPFPIGLPADVYRAPPLSKVIANTPDTEPTLPVWARPLVCYARLPPPSSILPFLPSYLLLPFVAGASAPVGC